MDNHATNRLRDDLNQVENELEFLRDEVADSSDVLMQSIREIERLDRELRERDAIIVAVVHRLDRLQDLSSE